jgi:hypothetical protein
MQMAWLRVIGIVALFVHPGLLAAQTSACDVGEASASAPAETQQFAFLLGDHEVTLHAWTGSDWTPPRPVNARWRGWYGLSGSAIYDEWEDPDPERGGLGVNVRIYDDAEAVWKMMWVSTSGMQVQDLRAEIRDGVLTMWQVYPERPGWKAEFEVIDDDQWARVSYQQDETGAWQPQFRLVATRGPC